MRITTGSLMAALVISAASTGCVISSDDDFGSELTVANRSSYVLTEVHLAELGDDSWGPDLLPDVLYPGEDLLIVDIRCGDYDVLVVDQTGVDCVLANVDLCLNSDVWVVDDVILDTCAFNPRLAPPTRPTQTDATSTAATASSR